MIPTCALLRPVVCAGMALALLLPAVAADAAAAKSNPITEGYHFAPGPAPAPVVAPPAENVPPADATSPGRQPRKRVQDPAQRLPEVAIDASLSATPPAPAAPAARVPAPGTLELPKITVTGEKEKPPRPLPQLHVGAPVKDMPTPEWESPEGRRARLVQKHFTALEQKLNSQQWLEARAAHEEAIDSVAAELNRIATAIDLSALLGVDDPDAQKALRAEFLRAFNDRPR
jgi:hypothetical protein